MNKNKPFEHHEVTGMAESANWMDYPYETWNDEDMQQDSTSPLKDASSIEPDPSTIVPTAKNITPIASHSERTNERDLYDAMDIKEEDTVKTPKKQNIEET